MIFCLVYILGCSVSANILLKKIDDGGLDTHFAMVPVFILLSWIYVFIYLVSNEKQE